MISKAELDDRGKEGNLYGFAVPPLGVAKIS